MRTLQRPPSYARVLADVFVLRQAIQYSELDNDLKDGGIEFAYFVDPSLVELYVEPAKWASRLAAFPSLYGDGEGRDTPADLSALRATALLTGQYIFSRTLVGPVADLYVTPDHFSELLGYVGKVERKHSEAVRLFEARVENAPELASEIVRRIRSSRAVQNAGLRRGGNLVEAWRQALVETLGEVSTEDLVITRRLNDLLAMGLLASASMRDEFTLDVVAPTQARVDAWMTLIRSAKQHNRTRNTREALEADAVTLEQLWLLNAGSDATRFVLVTDDAGVHSAYQEMCRQAAATEARKKLDDPAYDPVQHFFALRRPIQFTPILSLSDMGGAFRSDGLFQKIQAGVDYIAQTFTSSDEPEDNDQIVDFLDDALPTLSGPEGKLNSILIGMAEEIRSDWKTLVHYASSAKADVLAEEALGHEDYWTRFVQSSRFRQRFNDAARSFKEEAVSLSASSTLLRQEVWALHAAQERGAERGDDFSRRALATDFHGFASASLRTEGLSSVVDTWMESGAGALESLKNVEVRAERLLCVGALCLQIGAWGAAYRLLSEAIGPTLSPEDRRLQDEVRFFHAVASRLAATDRSWVKRGGDAAASLAFLRRSPALDAFGRARLASEEVAVALCQIPWNYEALDRNQITIILQQAEARVIAFSKKHLPALVEAHEVPHHAAVLKQICLNVFCMTAWRSIHNEGVPVRLRELHDEYAAIFATDWMTRFASGPHTDTYPILARLALSDGGEDRQRDAVEVIGRMDHLLAKDVEYSFALDMPTVDKKEFRQLRAWAKAFL